MATTTVERQAVLSRIEPSLKEALEQLARRNSRSASAEAAIAIRSHIEREGKS